MTASSSDLPPDRMPDRMPADILRLRAEALLAKRGGTDPNSLSPDDVLRLVHELEVHQVELEMQNDELLHLQDEREVLLTRYTDLYDFAPVGYMSLDRSGTIERINLTGARLLGVDRSALVQRRFGLFVELSARMLVHDFVEKVFADGVRHHCELSPAAADRPPLVLRLEGTRSENGQECRAVLLDITARRTADAALRLQSSALNAAANAISILDRDGTIEWCNPAFVQLTGFTQEEAIGSDPRVLLHSGEQDDSFYARRAAAMAAGRPWTGEMIQRRKDGQRYAEEQTITPVAGASGHAEYFISVGRDLSEQRRLEEQLLQAQKMETVGRLAGGIAHDFNNLLTVINGTADLALRDLTTEHPLHEELVEIMQAGQRAAALTRQLLAFSRKQIMHMKPLDLCQLVPDGQGMLLRLIGENITLTVSTDERECGVLADPTQLELVVLNLAVNARDAMPMGGRLDIDVRRIVVDAETPSDDERTPLGEYVQLRIRDSGIGMDAATRARIFEPFFTTKGIGEGTGLGLATVYGIVKQSGGLLQVHSTLGVGTTFTILLPRIELENGGLRTLPAARPAVGTEVVMVVEDEEAVRRLAERSLQLAGYTVMTAGSGDEAITLLKNHIGPVALLFTDIIMPGMRGWELGAAVRALRPEIRILYTSGYTDGSRLPSDQLLFQPNFLGKPYNASQLNVKVREILDAV